MLGLPAALRVVGGAAAAAALGAPLGPCFPALVVAATRRARDLSSDQSSDLSSAPATSAWPRFS